MINGDMVVVEDLAGGGCVDRARARIFACIWVVWNRRRKEMARVLFVKNRVLLEARWLA